jgi:hypothetical protein
MLTLYASPTYSARRVRWARIHLWTLQIVSPTSLQTSPEVPSTMYVTCALRLDSALNLMQCAVERKVIIMKPTWVLDNFDIWLRGDDFNLAEVRVPTIQFAIDQNYILEYRKTSLAHLRRCHPLPLRR